LSAVPSPASPPPRTHFQAGGTEAGVCNPRRSEREDVMWKRLEGFGARPGNRIAVLALVSLAVVAGPATASQWNLGASASPSNVVLGQGTTVTASVRNDGASTRGFIQILRRGGFQADLVLRNCE